MGSKLDQTHADLTRIASALSNPSVPILEAKSKAEKIQEKLRKKTEAQARKRAAKNKTTRSVEKTQKTQKALYKGQEPVGAGGEVGEPYQPPQNRPPTSTPTSSPTPPRPTQTPPPHQPSRPSRAVPSTPPHAAKEPSKTPAKPPAPPKPAPPPQKPRIMTEPTGAPQKKPSFLQRVKRTVVGLRKKPNTKKPSLPRRAVGAFRRIAGMFKRRLLGEEAQMMSRTMLALALSEERSSTTFKKCSPGSMVATPYLRHSLPQNQFVNPDKDNPTFPIRSNCRASMGGVGRALQKDMAGAGEATVKQVLQRVNQMGGTRGKTRLKLWGTGVGGKRMETYRGPPHKSKRTGTLAKRLGISKKRAVALHGISKGKPDMVKHTPPYSPTGGAKGPSGNREVNRAEQAHAKPAHRRSKRKEKRKESSRAVTIGRGKALAGR